MSKSKFNVGDKVRIARPGRYMEKWQDFEAVVEQPARSNKDILLTPLSEGPWGRYASFWWPEEDLELASAKPPLRAALDTLKEQEGLCGKFDRIVEVMLNDDPLERLKYAADQEGYEYLFTLLDKILNPPVKPKHEFKEGEWVRTPGGKIGKLVYISIFRDGHGDVHDVEGTYLWSGLISDLEPSAPAVPDKGRWVKATMGDGSTREFEVTTNYEGTESTQVANGIDTDWINDVFMMRIPHNPGEDRHNEPKTVVIDWEYIEAPKPPAKVGDVIEAKYPAPEAGVYAVLNDKVYAEAGDIINTVYEATLVWIDTDKEEEPLPF